MSNLWPQAERPSRRGVRSAASRWRSAPRWRPVPRLVTVAALVTLAGTVSSIVPSAVASSPTESPGWTRVWADDFTGAAGTLPSLENWIIDTGTGYPGGPANWGTGEVQTYTSNTANLQLDGESHLLIRPVLSGGTWTSARIETVRSDFKPPAGKAMRIEARIALPDVTGDAALGYWPAFWALGAPFRGNYWNWPGIGELDVMENVNGINTVWGALHCGVNPGGPCNETTGLGSRTTCITTACQGQFHTYALEWDRSVETAQQLRWYVDGQLFHIVNQSQAGSYWAELSSHAGYFLLLNVSMGGAFPAVFGGGPTPTTASGHPMIVDYVAVSTT